jgi:hypothetical protein
MALRLLAGVHALVLSGAVPELAEFYPSAGGRRGADDPGRWPAFRAVLVEHGAAVRGWLDSPPQTNEVGRAAALLGGLCRCADIAPLPIRLVEIGASGGLNLRADRFRVTGPAGTYGPVDSPVVLADAWLGAPVPDVTVDVLERVGADIAPIDPTTPDGRLRLTAYVWPDMAERLARLRGALDLAAEAPAQLHIESAVQTVRGLTLVAGCWTVLWHSVFRQYLSKDERRELRKAVDAVGAAATDDARFGYLMLEPVRDSPPDAFPVTLTTWPGGEAAVIGTAPAHGMPVTWLG